jgi:hypothetical protein
MFDLLVWQQVVIAIVALVSIGWMSFTIVRLFSRRASEQAIVREATAIESALVGGTVPEGARVFDGWSYRVGARFAGRVRVAVYDDRVAVAGPRVPRGLYQVWIWVQGLLLALVLPAAVAAVVTLDWRWLVAAAAIFVASFAVSIGGAGLWPGLGELQASETGYFKALEFPRASVREVAIGKGWSSTDARFVSRSTCTQKTTRTNSRTCLPRRPPAYPPNHRIEQTGRQQSTLGLRAHAAPGSSSASR